MDTSKYKFPKPTRNNLSKEEASKCKHHWAYGGGSMWCLNCGWFQQTDGKITKTVSGKGGEFLESAFIDISDYFEEGSKIDNLLDKIKVFWNKCINLLLRGLRLAKEKLFNNTKMSYDVESILTVSEMVDICKKLSPKKGDADSSREMLNKIEIKLNRQNSIKVSVSIYDIKNLEDELNKLIDTDNSVGEAMRSGYIEGELWQRWRNIVIKVSDVITKFIRDLDRVKNPDNPTRNPITESADPAYNTDMTELQAKKTMRTLSQSLMNDLTGDNKKMSQYTANIYANIITKNLLPKWANGFSRVKITLDSYQSFHTFEFITPPMGQDFVSRFINGRETLHGFLHRSPEIRIKMSPRIFNNMKNPDDAFNFFKAAIKYYDSQVERYGVKVVAEAMKLGHNMKHLISNTKLSGIVTYPLTMLFVFDDVDMSNKDTFKISNDDIQTINRFIKNISSRYAAPEKEKKQIVDDVKKMVEALKESCESTDTTRSLHYLPEAVDMLMFGGYDKMIVESSRLFIEAQIDRDWVPTPEAKYMKESWGVKKLKKIPKDLIPYIQIETEAIKDVNDKMILSSYTLGKIEIVEWYIELLTVGSKKYIVPHTKPYLELVRTQLLQCFKKIMDTSVNKKDKTVDIKYPPGYEG